MCGSEVEFGEVRWGDVCGSEGGEVRCVDRRSKTVKGGRKTHRGSAFGSVIGLRWRIGGEVRWGDVWIGGLKRSMVEGKLTVGLRLARWSNYREGLAVRWARCDLEWAGSVWVAGLVVKEVAELFLSLTLSLFCAWLGNGLKVKWKCKTISGSNE